MVRRANTWQISTDLYMKTNIFSDILIFFQHEFKPLLLQMKLVDLLKSHYVYFSYQIFKYIVEMLKFQRKPWYPEDIT